MKGISVKVVDSMGTDFRIFEAAKATLGGGTESNFNAVETDPTRLINFLAKERHVTPFRHPQITLECEAPIAIARQLGKHQVGFSWNERSMRYRDSVIDVFTPDMFRGRPAHLHEGSTDLDVSKNCTDLDIQEYTGDGLHLTNRTLLVDELYEKAMDSALCSYETLLAAGVAPEQARFVLPQGMITRWFWTGSLYGFYEVYRQRSSEHAQYEVRDFADQLDTLMTELFPIAWNALKSN